MILRRIMHGTAANAGGVIWVALYQLASVPLLTGLWGVEDYGIWLMLTALPTYFALSDLGFVSAAQSEMAMRFARGEKAETLAVFQSVWVLVWAVTGVLAAAAIVVTALPATFWAGIFHGAADAGWVIAILCVYAAAVLQARLFLAGLRSTGHYAGGTLLYDLIGLAEYAAVLVTAALGGGFLACALAMTTCRLANAAICGWRLTALEPWIDIGTGAATRLEIRRLAGPAFAALAMPSAVALNLQGTVLVAGFVISPAAAATYAAVRTVSRVAIQVIGLVNRASMPEMSAAHARAERRGVVQVIRVNLLAIGGLLVPGAIVFALAGSWIVRTWTFGRIDPDAAFIALMALAMALHGTWVFFGNLLLAVQAHEAIAWRVLGYTAIAIAATIPTAMIWGLDAIALCVIGVETVAVARTLSVMRSKGLLTSACLRRTPPSPIAETAL